MGGENMTQSQSHHYCRQVEEKLNRMLELADGLDEETLRRKPSPEKWSVMEVLCHVEEMLEYWMEELQRVVANRGGSWGRGLQDERRLAAVARADQRTLEDVTAGLRKAGTLVRDTVSKLSDDDLALEAPHRNEKFGVKPMTFLLDHFVVDHLEGHIGQIRRNLESFSGNGPE